MAKFIVAIPVLWILYMVLVGARRIKISQVDIFIPGLNRQLDGLKIVQLADLHLGSLGVTRNHIRRAVEKANNLHPDLILLTGDYVTLSAKNIGPCLEIIKNLQAKYGIYAVLGNHDHWVGKDKCLAGLKNIGIKVLVNENCKLNINGAELFLIGVDDPHRSHDNLDKALEGLPNSSEAPKILLSHSPDIIDKAINHKIDFVIAAHTHGGQINFPFIGPIVTASKHGRKYVAGWFKEDSTQMYVNRGIGSSYLPIRWLCPPEISLYKLKMPN